MSSFLVILPLLRTFSSSASDSPVGFEAARAAVTSPLARITPRVLVPSALHLLPMLCDFPGILIRYADPSHEIVEAGIVTDRVPGWLLFDEHELGDTLVVGPFQPTESLVDFPGKGEELRD